MSRRRPGTGRIRLIEPPGFGELEQAAAPIEAGELVLSQVEGGEGRQGGVEEERRGAVLDAPGVVAQRLVGLAQHELELAEVEKQNGHSASS
jgi:hypothetical protein